MKKGKRQFYMKDQPALDRFLIENGIENMTLRSSKGPELSGMVLFNLASRLRALRDTLHKIDQRCDARVVAAFLRTEGLTLAHFRDHALVDAAAAKLKARLEERYPDLCPLSVNVEWEKEHNAGRIVVKFRPGASSRPATLDWQLAESGEYQELLSIEEDIRSIGPAPYSVSVGKDDPITLPDAESLEAFITERAVKARKSPATRVSAK